MIPRRHVAWIAGLALAASLALASGSRAPLPVAAVDTVGFTVSNMDRSVAFYRDVLGFTAVSDTTAVGRPFELLTGVFGAHARSVRMRLGDEFIELTEFHAPRGRPVPDDLQPNDHAFQHIAIIVRDMDRAYARLRAHGVEHASTAPQRLPDWNPGAGGIRAFYFRDPDRHFLEILEFPPGKGLPKWHAPGEALFLGIDHTAIVVRDTEASLAFYRDTLGLALAGEGENYDLEQERLNNVFGARLRITTLRAPRGPGIELLEYLAPRTGRAAPPDLRANDLLHWQTTLVVPTLEPLIALARAHRLSLVSPGAVGLATGVAPFAEAALTRDPDGHGMRLAKPLPAR